MTGAKAIGSDPARWTVERRADGWAVILECPPGCTCGQRTPAGPFMSERDAARYRDALQDGWARGIPPEEIRFPPRRVRVAGDLAHGRVPAGAVYVGRPAYGLAGSKFANPFKGEGRTRAELAAAYAAWLGSEGPDAVVSGRRTYSRPYVLAHLAELAGRNLACWCPPGQPCHADILIEIANSPQTETPA